MEQAHDAGDFVRTHTLRPTWHFVAADDLAMVLAATSARVRRATAYTNRQVGVDHALMETARPVLEQRLAYGPTTRDEIGTALADAGIETTGWPGTGATSGTTTGGRRQ